MKAKKPASSGYPRRVFHRYLTGWAIQLGRFGVCFKASQHQKYVAFEWMPKEMRYVSSGRLELAEARARIDPCSSKKHQPIKAIKNPPPAGPTKFFNREPQGWLIRLARFGIRYGVTYYSTRGYNHLTFEWLPEGY